ncbi:hypothetical protein [Thiocapsa bogorovii]|uniref:hypothetical protein n=1 Tax=Thiocapsa bogorovii TaxID=521689 RepID=UPI001E4D848D|nr:hypothetical protein [Thiocapsa bogorovii]UHD14525.1 hypothetical protein LT988_14575 [Thiocapsa bogorovii]
MSTTPTSPLKIVIFGPYKTGTSGLHAKIANSVSGPLRSIFEKPSYTPEDADANQWVLAKTIAWFDGRTTAEKYASFLGFDRKIVLVRDPRDWIVSAVLFIVQQEPSIYEDDGKMVDILARLHAKETDPAGTPLASLLERVLELSDHHEYRRELDWMRDQFRWLPLFETEIGDHLVVRYEDFIDGRLADLESYLGFPLTGSAQVPTKIDHVPRTLGYGNWRHWLTETDVALFEPFFRDYMAHYGYRDAWDLAPNPSIPPEHCTGYVLRTVNKRRQTPLAWP